MATIEMMTQRGLESRVLQVPAALVAWMTNAASLPILAVGTLLLTQCTINLAQSSVPFSYITRIPHVNGIFVVALLASVALNFAATLLLTYTLA